MAILLLGNFTVLRKDYFNLVMYHPTPLLQHEEKIKVFSDMNSSEDFSTISPSEKQYWGYILRKLKMNSRKKKVWGQERLNHDEV